NSGDSGNCGNSGNSPVRVLILSTTTGYQLRAFGDAAKRIGIDLMFATDRCHKLDDPWRDDAIPVRFHEEDVSLLAILEAAQRRPIDGALQSFAIFDKPEPLDGPFFEETIYVTPSDLPREQQRAIVAQVQRATRALGLTTGPVHAECRVGPAGIFVLEIAPRPIGGLC